MVKCTSCGFLAFRTQAFSELPVPYLAEADQTTRDEGYNKQNAIYDIWPICFMRESGFMRERSQFPRSSADVVEATKGMLKRDRECSEFTEWRQGFTPKEHREMLDRQWMMEREDDRRKSDRRWRIIEVVALVIGAGIFTLLGVWLAGK